MTCRFPRQQPCHLMRWQSTNSGAPAAEGGAAGLPGQEHRRQPFCGEVSCLDCLPALVTRGSVLRQKQHLPFPVPCPPLFSFGRGGWRLINPSAPIDADDMDSSSVRSGMEPSRASACRLNKRCPLSFLPSASVPQDAPPSQVERCLDTIANLQEQLREARREVGRCCCS